MPVEERRRLHLYEVARDRLGVDAADTLMELLPPMDPSELATRSDLALTRSELRTEMAELRTELRTEMAELRTEMAELRTELRTEMAELRTELRTEMAELRVAVATMMREQTNRLLALVVPTMLTAVGLSFAAAQLSH
jgi:ribosomal protein L29